jgi:hypothetical protein
MLKRALLTIGLAGAFVPLGLALAQCNPWLVLIPCIAASGYSIRKSLPRLKTRQGRFAAAITVIFGGLFQSQAASAAIKFSVFLSATEEMMKTCIFDQITGWEVMLFFIFAALRIGMIYPIVENAMEMNKKLKNNHQADSEFRAIIIAIVTFVFIGLIEPLAAKSCGG